MKRIRATAWASAAAVPTASMVLTVMLALLAAAVLVGCTAPPVAERSWQDKLAASGWTIGAEVESVPNFTIDGFDALDDAHLVVHLGTRRRVLVTAAPGCIGLDDAHRIAYKGLGMTLGRLDSLRIAPPGLPPTRCLVEALHLLLPPKA